MLYYSSLYSSALGDIKIVSDGKNLSGLWFEGQKYYCAGLKCNFVENNNLPIFNDVKNWLDIYFSGCIPEKFCKLSLQGTPFQMLVWKILSEIPYGKTITYGDISAKLAKLMNKKSISAQAVGNAVGHNPVSIIIPCHRVVARDKNLCGYAGGLDKKYDLLKLEGLNVSKSFNENRQTYVYKII